MAHSLEEALAAAGLTTASGGQRPAAASEPTEPAGAGRPAARPHWLTARTVGVSSHAVERFRERFMPHLNHPEAQTFLCELLYETGSLSFIADSRPNHDRHPGRPNRMRGYLIVDHDIVLVLKEGRRLPTADGHRPYQRFYAVTCLNRWYWEEHWVPPA